MKWRMSIVVITVVVVCVAVAFSLVRWPVGQQLVTENGVEAIPSCSDGLPPVGGDVLPLPLSLVVWNMQKMGGDDEGRRELQALTHHADILLLQEATALNPPPLAHVQQVEAFRYAGDSYGVGALARNDLSRPCALLTPEPLLRIPKSALAWRQKLADGRTLLLINVHAINFDWRVSTYQAWLDQLGLLIAAHQGPVVLAGDFNSWNDGRASALATWAAAQGLTEASFTPDRRVRHLGHAIDTVWVRGLRILATGSARDSYADHNPLWITVDWMSLVPASP